MLAFNHDGRTLDPLLRWTAPSDGTFIEERGAEIDLGPAWVNAVNVVRLAKGGPTALMVSTSDAGMKGASGAIRCYVVRRNT